MDQLQLFVSQKWINFCHFLVFLVTITSITFSISTITTNTITIASRMYKNGQF